MEERHFVWLVSSPYFLGHNNNNVKKIKRKNFKKKRREVRSGQAKISKNRRKCTLLDKFNISTLSKYDIHKLFLKLTLMVKLITQLSVFKPRVKS